MKTKNYFYLAVILAWLIQPSGIFAQGDWTNMNASPMPLISAAVAFIGDDKVVLFGGYDGVTEGLDQTWIYDLSDNTWTLKNPAVKPPGRYAQGMAYIGGDKILMTGGSVGGINTPVTYYTDTWMYDLSDNTWTNMALSPAPAMASILAMDYAGGDKVVQVRDGYTWIFDLSDNAWTLANTSGPNAYTGDQVSYIGGDKIFVHSFNAVSYTHL